MKKANAIGFTQGDVIGLYVAEIPKNARPTQQRIVAYGEATGHHHVIEGAGEAYEVKEGFYFVVAPDETVTIRHIGDEHDAIEMIPGILFIPREAQVEYDGAEERRVLD